jgi:putative NADH-flavin reductase
LLSLVQAVEGEMMADEAAQTLLETREAIPGTIPRILHMGGSPTLLTAQSSHCFVLRDFPEAYRGPALGQAQASDYYRGDTNGRASWTYLSSPPVYFAPGKRTGECRIGLDHPVEDATGRSSLSHGDSAVAMVDEVVRRRFIKKGFTVGYRWRNS